MERVARQRLGTDPRSALGAPLILANKDLQVGHLVIQIVKCHGNLQGTPVLIDDGMTGESSGYKTSIGAGRSPDSCQ